jgi:hypothetical protein
MRVDLNNWSVALVEDSDGHLNMYIMNVESNDLYEVDGDQHGDELHYRITSKEIEEAYHETT